MKHRLGVALFLIWAVVFLCGAMGEIFGIDALRSVTDVTGLFLR